jgi:hypothetical protein
VGDPGPNQTSGLPMDADPRISGEQRANFTQNLIPFGVPRHPFSEGLNGRRPAMGSRNAPGNRFRRPKLRDGNKKRRCCIGIDWKQFQ